VFAQVLGNLEQISHELIPRTLEAQRQWTFSTTPPARSGCARQSSVAWRAGSRRAEHRPLTGDLF
jgi:hypothetical protein